MVWLDEIPFGNIINQFGLPVKNFSFNKDSIKINGVCYSRGLGTHPPSDLMINIDGIPSIFEAIIGISYANNQGSLKESESHRIRSHNEIKQSPGIIFRLFADEKLIYQFNFTEESKPEKIRIKLKNVNKLRLVTVASEPGYVAMSSNWALAHLRFSEDVNPASLNISSFPVHIMHNQAGFKPDSYKSCIIPAEKIDSLYIYESESDQLAFSTTIDIFSGDFGKYLLADFSEFNVPGNYYLMSGGNRSGNFNINENIYNDMSLSHLNFIVKQRNKDLISGSQEFKEPHDAKENIIPKDLNSPGSWKYSKDHIENNNSIAHMLYALTIYYENCKDTETRKIILNEIKYGNRLLLSLQEPAGNIIGRGNSGIKDQTDVRLLSENIPENKIEPVIQFDPSQNLTLFVLSMAQSRLSRLIRMDDHDYSDTCIQSAIKSFKYSTENFTYRNAYSLGAALGAATELFLSMGKDSYKLLAVDLATELVKLSVMSEVKPSVFFKTSETDTIPASEIITGSSNWPLAGLCIYLKAIPQGNQRLDIKTHVSTYCRDYIEHHSKNNAFNLIPYALFNRNPGGNRRSGRYFYRYFAENDVTKNSWRGTNHFIASTAACLVMASEILDQPELKKIAQKQLDWIYGANPFNVSFVTGWGYNHPPLYESSHLSIPDSLIKGGVMAGIGSDQSDVPALYPGWRQTSGYWMPAVANTLWLTVLLDK